MVDSNNSNNVYIILKSVMLSLLFQRKNDYIEINTEFTVHSITFFSKGYVPLFILSY